MRVLFAGEPNDGISVSSHHARLLAQVGVEVAFDEPGLSWRQVGRDVDIVHVVTGLQTDNALLRRIVKARSTGAAIIRFWTGLDVLWAQVHGPTLRFAQTLDHLRCLQIAPTPDLADRLRRIGISARPGPVATALVCARQNPQPLPPQFTVLARLPADRREFFGGPIVDALIRRFRAARFLILGDDPARYRGIESVEALPYVDDVSRTIQRATVLVQPVRWGRRSRLMLEVLSHGRHVVSSIPHEQARFAETTEGFAAALRELGADPPFHLEGREHACRDEDRGIISHALHRELERCLDESACGPRSNGAWLAGMAALRNPLVCGTRSFAAPAIDKLPQDLSFLGLLLPAGEPHLAATGAGGGL
ncbi:MAG: hypothetical protein IT429_26290 [Gemmataceae bacterium]|nr:hypothetical protein [Gemmataceae bacterium]